jgi:Tellurite resistance protein TerB.
MTKNTIMGHIINLLSIAYADGSITEEEKNLICNISDNLGLTNEEFNHCLATWQETDEDILKVSMPEAEEDRIAFLKNMTLLMMIDGEIDENERQYISDAAELYGFDGEQAVNYLIKQIQRNTAVVAKQRKKSRRKRKKRMNCLKELTMKIILIRCGTTWSQKTSRKPLIPSMYQHCVTRLPETSFWSSLASTRVCSG